MFELSKTYFTADTHFGHQRTLELSKRPYHSVEEMNEDMIKRWNDTVNEEDTVYHLGDFGDWEVAKRLKGKIILIFGNYDYDLMKHEYVNKEQLNYFHQIIQDKETIETFNEKVYGLVHEPMNNKSGEFYLFGHIHKLQMVKRNGLNVGVDCHHFTPIDLDTIEFYRNAIENHYDEEVFAE